MSKERPRANNNNNNNNSGPAERQSLSDYERIKEREKELERIHRRSRELMASPRSQDGSLERRRTGAQVVEQHHRMTANCHPAPPPCHPPPPLYPRYKSPSPQDQSSNRTHSLRKRVQSPSRSDYRDFSSHARELLSPCRTYRYTDDEDDSGADSMTETSHTSHSQAGGCHWPIVSHPSYPQHPGYPQHQHLHQHGGHHGHQHQYPPHCPCPSCLHQPHNMQVALPGRVEERLLALEGDKDQLHMQVSMLSDQIHNQTDKILDLERTLDSKKEALKKTEDLLQTEMINRSGLETTKLELLSEVSGLKLRQTTTEKENEELRRQLARTLRLAESGHDGFRSLPRRTTSPGFRPVAPPGEREQLSRLGGAPSPSIGDREQTPSRGDTAWARGEPGRRSGSFTQGSAVKLRTRAPSSERPSSSGGASNNRQPIATKPSGLRRILSKMRRSNSGHSLQAGARSPARCCARCSSRPGSPRDCCWSC